MAVTDLQHTAQEIHRIVGLLRKPIPRCLIVFIQLIIERQLQPQIVPDERAIGQKEGRSKSTGQTSR